MNRPTGLAAAGLLLFSLTISGCSSFATSIINSMVHGHEFAEDNRVCENRCSVFKDDEYTFCYRQCMAGQTERRRRDKGKLGARGLRTREGGVRQESQVSVKVSPNMV